MSGSALVLSLTALACVLLPLCAAQGSCQDRCGEPFVRGHMCSCDHSCFIHGECCKDFEILCTTGESCTGRCGESFRRGRECDCDPDCVHHNTCCSNYHHECEALSNPEIARSLKLNHDRDGTDECIAACLATEQHPDLWREGEILHENQNELIAPTEAPSLLEEEPKAQDNGITSTQTPSDMPDMESIPSGFSLSESGPAAGELQTGDVSLGKPLTIPVHVSLFIGGHGHGSSSGPASDPTTQTDMTEVSTASSPAEPDVNSNPGLCNGISIDGLATLFNGSTIVFRGHFFWLLNPKTRRAGPARNISEELGIPSPIDTVFTRCNCQHKTYVFKGDNYWGFENGKKEAGYPRSVSKDFGGLRGGITAALPVPATRKRPEMVYFFKKGGTVQKLSFTPGSGPICNGKKLRNPVHSRNQRAKQAEVQLSGEIRISLKSKGFPAPVTSALSVPNPGKSEGFDYFVFSWPKVYGVKISGDLPNLATPASHSSQQSDVKKWLNCA